MDILDGSVSRERLASFLPAAISKALDSYHTFSGRIAPDDPKEFSAYHAGCKAAISHVELLFKLAKWANIADEIAPEKNQQLDNLLVQAEQEILEFKKIEKTKE